MRLAVALLISTLLTGSLAACSSGSGVPKTTSTTADDSVQTVSTEPVELRSSVILSQMHGGANLGGDAATLGIYAVASKTVVNGYPYNDRSNGPPVCSIGSFNDLSNSDIAVDRKGDLLVADGGSNTISVFQGPSLCGPKLGSIADPFGTTVVDLASRDGKRIVVAYDRQLSQRVEPGVAVCTLAGGCTRHLNPGLGRALIYGVAVAPNGDCWASLKSVKYSNALVYFAHCRGKGVLTTGFTDDAVGGLDIDANGNLLSFAYTATPDLRVYSGCNPKCTHVGGPFPLRGGGSTYGHLNGRSNKLIFAEGNDGYGKLDVYSYSPSSISYLYSITNGLSLEAGAAAFSPSSKE